MDSFNKEKVFWTKSMNIDLVKFMEDKPYIWNMKDPQFSNLGLRDETFAKFAAKYNNEFTWTAAKDRWTNIRSAYGALMRKIIAKRAKGEDFKVNWFLWEPCKYLQKVYKLGHKEKKKKQKISSKEKNHENSQNMKDESGSSDGDMNHSNDMEDDSNSVNCENIAENLVSVFRGFQNNAFSVEDSQIGAVGQAVTKTLSELNTYDAAQLSVRILEVLAKYDDRNPDNPNNSLQCS